METTCPKCGGTGFVPKEKGTVELCACRFEKEDVNKVLGIPKRFWEAELDNYQYENPSEEKGVKGKFFDTKDLIYRLKALIEEGKTSRAIRRILSYPLIVLDDLGSERLSEWQREIISYIISYRYNNLKSTIITTNFSLTGEEKENRKIKKTAPDF